MAKDLTPSKPLQAKRPLSSAQCLTRNAYNKKQGNHSSRMPACEMTSLVPLFYSLLTKRTRSAAKFFFCCRGGGVLAFLLPRFVARAMRACVPLPAGQLPFAYAASVYFVHRAFMPVVVL